eukprot:gnl/Dysnectes_brevis/4830_a6678_773.p1 GENE.gnl/Dysnectes_brevis/4830_a6678_773~~gnl/Dysnectes_brevis/4830_a6678_773.p1  ORF type:complete len:285 (-),score=49.02 gnl/Dysnectes_brevis/4830_a6678_773:48-866(-)
MSSRASTSAEVSIFKAHAMVYRNDPAKKSWVPLDKGLVEVDIYKNNTTNAHRIIARPPKNRSNVLVNSSIISRVRFKLQGKFLQYTDARGRSFGFNFKEEQMATQFEGHLTEASKPATEAPKPAARSNAAAIAAAATAVTKTRASLPRNPRAHAPSESESESESDDPESSDSLDRVGRLAKTLQMGPKAAKVPSTVPMRPSVIKDVELPTEIELNGEILKLKAMTVPSDDLVLTRSDLSAWKESLLREVRSEMSRARTEIVQVIRDRMAAKR